MPYSFALVHSSIFSGSFNKEPAYVFKVWIAMILLSDGGVVSASVDHLAAYTCLGANLVRDALERLSAEDPDSRTIKEDGRRIVPVDGYRHTWRIVNFDQYQPLLGREKAEPFQPPRRLADGSDNPAYWAWHKRKQREKRKEVDMVDVVDTRSDARLEPEKCGGQNGGHSQVQTGQNVHHVHLNKIKGNERKEDPSISPLEVSTVKKERKTPVSKKAIESRGNPANDEAFAMFDKVFPRRPDGRSINRAEARLIFDRLMEAGEDPKAIADGAARYARNLRLRKETKFIKMMTTFLNGRGWEESYRIDPDSDEGRKIEAERADRNRARRHAHQDRYKPVFEAYVHDLGLRGIESDETFEERYQAFCKDRSERRSRMSGAGAKLESLLAQPEAREKDKVDFFFKGQTVIDFWEWDRAHNPEKFKEEPSEL